MKKSAIPPYQWFGAAFFAAHFIWMMGNSKPPFSTATDAVQFLLLTAVVMLTLMLIEQITLQQPASNHVHHSNPSNPPNAAKKRLLSLLNGDEDAAERLINHARRVTPGKSHTWYYEKVAEDLIRDRR